MSRSQNLRHDATNQVINNTARGFTPPPLPPQSVLVEMYNISRITVCHVLCHLCKRSILSQVNHDYQVLRQPEVQDGLDGSSVSLTEQSHLFE